MFGDRIRSNYQTASKSFIRQLFRTDTSGRIPIHNRTHGHPGNFIRLLGIRMHIRLFSTALSQADAQHFPEQSDPDHRDLHLELYAFQRGKPCRNFSDFRRFTASDCRSLVHVSGDTPQRRVPVHADGHLAGL